MARAVDTVAGLASLVGGTLAAPQDGPTDVTVRDVTHDSREAGPYTLFVAIRGSQADGHSFVPAATAAGAPAVCVDHHTGSGVPEIIVPDTRVALGLLAAAVHDQPSRSMSVVGVTGTNGKTTVTHYVHSIVGSAGLTAGLIGTIRYVVGDTATPSVRTTPEASDLQRLLARMREEGAEVAALEVSSHALALGRVNGTRFAVAAFTNLSQDHLDFHGDMDAYLAAKRSLFEDYEVETAVLNVDDAAGRLIAESYSGEMMTVGRGGAVRHGDVVPDATGTTFNLETPWGSARVRAPLLGSFNVTNAAIAAASSLALGLDLDEVAGGLESLKGVPGRFEVVSGSDPVRVVVDYAHTPEGIREAIAAARDLTGGRVVAVVGAGGDRDRAKRPLMGAAASLADLAVITSDNPRSEDPGSIAAAVVSGLEPSTESIVELDRRRAIQQAVDLATDGDVVLVLGRGHEPTQEVAGERRPFDDREVAREALRRRRGSTAADASSGSM